MRGQEKFSSGILVMLALTAAFFAFALHLSSPSGTKDGYTVTTQYAAAEPTAPARPLVDINTADAAQLEALTGIGSVLAQRIVDYRAEHGAFAAAEDLLAVHGIGETTLDGFRHEITLGGDGT